MLSSPTASNWLKISPLEVLITRACDPSLPEPNYAVHLEIAEYINNKKANTPREAAMNIARLANNRNPHVSMLALALLDTLVQSCGYPFHLQISTKEFLNELVRRFPERPPPYPNAVMSRILELIHNWKEGICAESRWKDDLGNIRDMHRLLTFKGYRFRDLPRQSSSVASTASQNLKSAEELEEEDREAQSAKLQELIRRGTPRDLAAAQELMKSLAGANPDAKPDYRTQALNEINKLESKVILLNELLDNVDTSRGEQFVSGDAYHQVAAILTSARPKLQKWVSDAESHDSESLDTFLQMNDQINSVLNRYEAFKKGDYAAAANPIPAELSGPSSAGLSLIDFDDAQTSSNAAPTGSATGTDDLAELFGPPTTNANTKPIMGAPATVGTGFGAGMGFGGVGMGFNSNNASTMPYSPSPVQPMNGGMGMGMGANAFGGQFGISGGNANPVLRATSLSPPRASGTPPGSIMLPSTPGKGSPAPHPPNYFGGSSHSGMGLGLGSGTRTGSGTGASFGNGLGMGNGNGMGMNSGMGSMGTGIGFTAQQPTLQPQQTQQQQPPSTTPQVQGKDPFADLAGLF